MKRTLIAILMALALVLIPVGSALAATSAEVTVTATPGFVSITNLPNSFDFGVVTGGSTPNTTTGWFTITNASTVAMDVNIKCTAWTSWTYGAPAEDQGQLKASDGDGAYDVTIVAINTDYLLMSAVGVGVDPTWELQLDAPTSFTNVDVQTTTVTITAVVTP